MAASGSHEIVILGANFAGISTAHYLLRHTIPALSQLNPSISYRVSLVSPSTHFFWKVGAPRTLVSPDLLPIDKAFIPIADGFKQYSPQQYRFIQGSAVGLSADLKVVTINQEQTTFTISYSTLVIATGTSSNTALWTLNGSHVLSVEAFKDMQKMLPTAKTILIAGGGPAGTETAGEVAFVYPKAKITILSGTSRLLSRLKPAVSEDADSRLKQLGVEVIHDVRVSSVREGRPTELTLSDGTTRVVDVYIDSTGGKPNSSFLPSSWLNERGYVFNDEKTLRLTVPNTEGIYAVGDIGSYSTGGILDINGAIIPLCSSIHVDLASKIDKDKVKASTGVMSYFFSKNPTEPQQHYVKYMKDTQLVPIGPKGGVGQILGWKIPSLMVWGIKGRTYMIEKAEPRVHGAIS